MRIENGGPDLRLTEVVLFPFDDHSFPFQRGVRLQLVGRNSAAAEVVLRPGPPGTPDAQAISYYGSVCRVGDELWMWYLGQGAGEGAHQRLCLATSRDGRRWEKPALGLVDYHGTTQNNLVDLGGGKNSVAATATLYEPDEPDPGRRFKMVFETHGRNPEHGQRAEFNVAFSEDGLRWTERPVEPHDLSCEMAGVTKLDGCYYVCAQSGGGHFGPPRKLETFVSYDFERWLPADCLGFMRGSIPPRPMIYEQHAGEQVHLGAGLWNRGNVILGVYGQWHGHPTNDRRLVAIDLGLVVSNDALHYREPIPDFRLITAEEHGWLGEVPGQALLYPALEQGQGFENVGDETLTWYGSWSGRDGVRVAAWPRDRLGYFEAFRGHKMRSLDEAQVVSAPLDLERKAARVFVNVDGLSEHSRIEVGVLSERFEPIAGFEPEACVAPSESGLRQPIRWQEHDRIQNVDERVRLRLSFGGLRPEDVRIYAVYVEESD
jgi:hypothetical protein